MKACGQKRGVKVGAEEHGLKGITNGLMSPFTGAVLMAGIGASGVNGVIKFGEESDNFRILVQFATLVQDNIFVFDVRGVFLKPFSKPDERRAFGYMGDTIESSGVMVGN